MSIKNGAWIETVDGQAYSLDTPDPAMLNPEMIAASLSKLCRFGCHCRKFYSVAQHSVLVSRHVIDRLRLPALMHDCHEILWGFMDLPRPAKLMGPPEMRAFLTSLATTHDEAVCKRFDIKFTDMLSVEVHQADNEALATEARDLMLPPPAPWVRLPPPWPETIVPMVPQDAEEWFLAELKWLLKCQ